MPKLISHEQDVRISFLVPHDLMIRSRKITWGGRSPALRVLFEKLVDAVEKNGEKMIGAIIDGEFEITYKPKEERDAKP